MDIMDIDADFGKFDYIIAHGVYSWVPENVRNKVMEICSSNLSENGIAYISYNTFPGWHIRSIVREATQFHCKNIRRKLFLATRNRPWQPVMDP